MTADLHLHTHYSDGNWSPAELVSAAVKLGFHCIALTDHDTVAGLAEMHEAASGLIRVIDGIELNTIWTNPDGTKQDVHILGYFINKSNKDLSEAILKQQKARTDYVEETLDRLRSKGHKIELQDVLAEAGKGSVGRPHICKAMLKRGICRDVQVAYRMLMNNDSDCKVVRRSITPQEAVLAIHSAGGIPSLAHPGKDPFIPELLDCLKDCNLRALEAYHRGHSNTLVRKYLNMARERKLLVTGGSDCHGPYEKFPATIGEIRLPMELVRQLDRENAKHETRTMLESSTKQSNQATRQSSKSTKQSNQGSKASKPAKTKQEK